MPIPTVTLYSRPGCHLCEVIKEQLERIRREVDFQIEERDIDQEASLRERYNDDIPVVAVNGQDVFQHRIDIRKLREMLRSESSGGQAE